MKAVVIGAGPAGLTAAQTLIEEGGGKWEVSVLEESGEIGGLSRTVVHGDCRIDIGGHRFFSKSPEVNAIWDRLMPRQGSPSRDDLALNRPCELSLGGPDPECEDRVMLSRRRVSRIYYLRHFFDYPLSLKPATIVAMGIGRTLLAGLSYLCSVLFKRTERSLEDFYINRFGRRLYSMFFEDYTRKLWGVHPSEISPEWGAQRVKGLSLTRAILNIFKLGPKETSLIEKFVYPKRGPGQLWELLAEQLQERGVEVRLNAKVVRIDTAGDRVTGVILESGERVCCDAVFSSMPIRDLVAGFPCVPNDVAAVASGLVYRDFITVGLLVDRLQVRNETSWPTVRNIVPDTWIYVQERDVRLGRIQIFNNWSPYMVGDKCESVWIGLEYFCTEGDALWAMSDEKFVDMAAGELRHIGVLATGTPIRDAVRIRVKKAYPAYFGTYAKFGVVRKWLDGFTNLYCIGRNGQHRYNNMDHSMMCGIEAARALINGCGHDRVWSVNTEESYLESSK